MKLGFDRYLVDYCALNSVSCSLYTIGMSARLHAHTEIHVLVVPGEPNLKLVQISVSHGNLVIFISHTSILAGAGLDTCGPPNLGSK